MAKKDKSFRFLYQEEENTNYRENIEKYLFHWKWFVLSLIFAFLVGYTYLRYTPHMYKVSTSILIDNEYNGGLISDISALEELGVVGKTNTLVENEIGILKSRSLMESVIKDLEMNIIYLEEGNVKTSEIFMNKCPIKINFFTKDSLFYHADTTFIVVINSKEDFTIINVDESLSAKYQFGENIHTSIGNMTITPYDLDNPKLTKEVIVKIKPLKNIVDRYRAKLKIDFLLKGSDILNLSIEDNISEKSKLVLNKLTENYNNNAVEVKSLIAINTNEFIKQRLEVIEKDLTVVDQGVQNFKTKNNITDISIESSLVLNATSRIEKEMIEINTQIRLAEYVEDYLMNNPEDIIPANLGIGEGTLINNTQRYNELLLERNRILKSSKDQNPVIINLNNQVRELRESVLQSLVNLKESLTISLSQLELEDTRLRSKIQSVPLQERQFRDIERQQKIFESLYLYLLQKREENAILLAATMPNAKIIDPAISNKIHISPTPIRIYLLAILIGLITPFVFLYFYFLYDNTVVESKTVEHVIGAPFLGEIPFNNAEDNVVLSDNYSYIADSFRMLRTNINFMFSDIKSDSKVISITSTIPGEGKTFIAINLASVLAISGKKVLLIGADIRKPKIANYLNVPKKEIGLSAYLMDEAIKIEEIIEPVENNLFDIIQSGIATSIPSELLMKPRLNEAIEFAREKYDYVIIDTAPVNYVSDTLLLGEKSDLFIYVVRAHFLDKRLLEVPQKIFKEKRLKKMAVLLNCADLKKRYGYSYEYSYTESKKMFNWKKYIPFIKS